MTVLEKVAEPTVHSHAVHSNTVHPHTVHFNINAGLVVDPTDITFDDLTRDTVMIRVRIRNEGEHRSIPTNVRLETAPLGAFVPWRPLATLPVPALEPGESRELSVAATRPHPMKLGNFDSVPPTSVLRAQEGSFDTPAPQPNIRPRTRLEELLQGRVTSSPANNPPIAGRPAPQPDARSRMLLELMRQRNPMQQLALKRQLELIRRQATSRPVRNAMPALAQGRMLSPDLWEFFGQEQRHWAGNINVFIGARAVERHVASNMRIYSGRTNLAMLDVGGPGTRDSYQFDLVGLPSDWKAALHNMTGAKTLVVQSSDKPIQEKQWVEAFGMMLVTLAVRPPVICEAGKLQVHVTRQSCGKTAVVEFDLDPTAPGPGCFAV
jgi:hypothetical protein